MRLTLAMTRPGKPLRLESGRLSCNYSSVQLARVKSGHSRLLRISEVDCSAAS
jgi:hypothetical protein